MSPMEAGWIISAGLGSVVGLILALTGAGGAIVAVPLLIFGLHLSVPEAAPIALLAVGLSAGLGATLGLRERKVRYKAAGLMALCGVVISPFGIWVAHRVPNTPLTLLFAVVLAYVAVRMFRQARAAPSTEPRPRRTAPPCHLDSTTASSSGRCRARAHWLRRAWAQASYPGCWAWAAALSSCPHCAARPICRCKPSSPPRWR